MIKGRNGREIAWATGTRKALHELPAVVRWEFGRALYKAQLGKRSDISSPMKGRLQGVLELA
jgi:phage-related protein